MLIAVAFEWRGFSCSSKGYSIQSSCHAQGSCMVHWLLQSYAKLAEHRSASHDSATYCIGWRAELECLEASLEWQPHKSVGWESQRALKRINGQPTTEDWDGFMANLGELPPMPEVEGAHTIVWECKESWWSKDCSSKRGSRRGSSRSSGSLLRLLSHWVVC